MSLILMGRRRGGISLGAGEIAIALHRFASGTGSTLCGLGVPLRPGDLLPANIGNVSLTLDGQGEVAIYAEALEGRYSDGSARSLYIEVDGGTMTRGTPRTGVLRLHTPFTVARRTISSDVDRASWQSNGPVSTGAFSGWRDAGTGTPPGVIVASSPAHNCAAMAWLGPMLPQSSWPSFSGSADYITSFQSTLDTTVRAHDGSLLAGTSYPRDIALLRWWAATGDIGILETALQWMARMRTMYWAPNAWSTPDSRLAQQPVAASYFLRRDTEARTALVGTNNVTGLLFTQARTDGTAWDALTGRVEARGLAQRLRTLTYAQTLGVSYHFNLIDGTIATGVNQHAERISNSLGWNGSTFEWGAPGCTSTIISRFFMLALLADSVRELVGVSAPSSDLTTFLGRIDTMLEWMRGQTIVSPNGVTTFPYDTVASCDGTTNPTVDLNGFHPHLFAWRAARLGVTADANLARTLLATVTTGTPGSFLSGQKQWDEGFAWSPLTFSYLAQAGI